MTDPHIPIPEICSNCRYYQVVGAPYTLLLVKAPRGQCRRYPPLGRKWPAVSNEAWCGEYSHSKATLEKMKAQLHEEAALKSRTRHFE
jgi:hypothetical protein